MPQPIAEWEALTVLGELDVGSERQALRIVRDDGFDVGVEQSFETSPIAAARLGGRGRCVEEGRGRRSRGPIGLHSVNDGRAG
jgi:hypothetical protein